MNQSKQSKRKERWDNMSAGSRRDLIRDGLRVWAPSYPRRVNRTQAWANAPTEAVELLMQAEQDRHNAPFVSTYSFPRGHTKEQAVPRIDTLFIDFDFEGGDYESGSGDVDAWRRDLSHLLVRVRRVAAYIQEHGGGHWRASLSGHKGVHLFLDFPPLNPEAGSFPEFLAGMSEYATELVAHLSSETGIGDLDKYVDVTSSDLGRLCRVPNTIHGGATDSFGETRYCVPVSIEELANITTDKYISWTQSPREPPAERSPNNDVNEVLTRYVKTATVGQRRSRSSPTPINWERVSDYEEQSNDSISLEDIEFLTSDRPCLWKFYQRDDKYRHGQQSHIMELFCIIELLHRNVPIDVIVEFLDSAPEFDETYSRQKIREVIAHDYNRFTIERLLKTAPEFSGHPDCGICQAVLQSMDTQS